MPLGLMESMWYNYLICFFFLYCLFYLFLFRNFEVFGELLNGFYVVQQIENVETVKKRPILDVRIIDSGEIVMN
jgi:cyclophilin family peptidyl-prolyl cis-trans isomerase